MIATCIVCQCHCTRSTAGGEPHGHPCCVYLGGFPSCPAKQIGAKPELGVRLRDDTMCLTFEELEDKGPDSDTESSV